MVRTTLQISEAAVQDLELNSQYLTTFAFSRNNYGLKVSIVGCMELIELADSDELVKGYINLRNKKIVVTDLRKSCRIAPTDIDVQTCIVLVDTKLDGRYIKVGVMLQGISEVLSIATCDMDAGTENVGIDLVFKLANQEDAIKLDKQLISRFYD